jgi:hypothetical protein
VPAYTTTAPDNTIQPYGVPIGSTIANGVHIDAKNMAWDTHVSGRDILFNGLQAIGGRLAGFHVRSQRTLLRNCSARSLVGPALWLRGGQQATLAGDDCKVTGFTSEYTNLFNDTQTGIDWREFGAIIDEGYDNEVDASVSLCGGPALSVGRIDAIPKRGSYDLRAKDICRFTAGAKVAIDIVTAGAGANLTVERLLLHDTIGKVTNLIRRANDTINLDVHRARGYGYSGSAVVTTSGTSANLNMSDSDA